MLSGRRVKRLMGSSSSTIPLAWDMNLRVCETVAFGSGDGIVKFFCGFDPEGYGVFCV